MRKRQTEADTGRCSLCQERIDVANMPPVGTSNAGLSQVHVTAAKGRSKGFLVDTECSSYHHSNSGQVASA